MPVFYKLLLCKGSSHLPESRYTHTHPQGMKNQRRKFLVEYTFCKDVKEVGIGRNLKCHMWKANDNTFHLLQKNWETKMNRIAESDWMRIYLSFHSQLLSDFKICFWFVVYFKFAWKAVKASLRTGCECFKVFYSTVTCNLLDPVLTKMNSITYIGSWTPT